MDTLTNPSDELFAYGPLVTVQLAATTPGASSMTSELLVDTGADVTVIDEDLAARLGTIAVRSMEISGVTSTRLSVPVHTVMVIFPLLGLNLETDVVVLPRANDEVAGLIGRDVLQHLRFHYDGPAGSFTLSAS